MDHMHGDKGGACACIAAVQGICELKIKKNVIISCAFAENAIGSGAYKPGDIIKAKNGLAVNIGNTDAEGRLVMADSMTYVQEKFDPKKVMYIATLTGGCIVALGLDTAGLFSTDDKFADDILSASKKCHEPFWRLPVNDEFREKIKSSKLAWDITNNSGSAWGGAAQAACFLECFIEKDRPWAHLDIAGPSIGLTDDCTGFGAQTLIEVIDKL